MKSNSSEVEGSSWGGQPLEANEASSSLLVPNHDFHGSIADDGSYSLTRDSKDIQSELSSLSEKLEAKKSEVAYFARRVSQLTTLLECQSAKNEALRLVEELERRFGEDDQGGLAQMEKQLKSAQEEAQLRLSQLHHVQEELEYYFLLSREQARLLDESNRLHAKAFAIISDLGLKLI